MATITITIDGKNVTEKDLYDGLNNSGKFFKEAFSPKSRYVYNYLNVNMRNVLRATVRRRFDTETDPSGKKWKPLSRYREEQRGSSGPILQDTVKLKNSIQVQRPEVVGDTLEIQQSTKLPYAWVHQPMGNPLFGTLGNRGGYEGLFFKNYVDKSTGHVFKNEIFIATRAFLGFDKESGDEITRAENKFVKLVVSDFTKTLKNEVI